MQIVTVNVNDQVRIDLGHRAVTIPVETILAMDRVLKYAVASGEIVSIENYEINGKTRWDVSCNSENAHGMSPFEAMLNFYIEHLEADE